MCRECRTCRDCGLKLQDGELLKLDDICDPCEEQLDHQDADADDDRMRAISE